MRKLLIPIIFVLFYSNLLAQAKPNEHLKTDFQLTVDNDLFTLNINRDRYYSSGIYPQVRWLLDSGASSKRIASIKFHHQIYTPRLVKWDRLNQLDRPYAGVMSLSMAIENYLKYGGYFKSEMELGWLGPAVKIGEQQDTWHRWLGIPRPKGWRYQINDTPLINLHLRYIHPFYSSYRFELASETNTSFGTVRNLIRQGVVFRLGELRPMHQSAFVSSSLGNSKKQKQQNTEEFYFFYSPGVEYVIHNATLEGGFIGEESIFTVKATPWVIQHRFGVMFSWPRFDLSITRFWRTSENSTAYSHSYVGIRMNQRF